MGLFLALLLFIVGYGSRPTDQYPYEFFRTFFIVFVLYVTFGSTCILFLLNQILYIVIYDELTRFYKYFLPIAYDRAYDMSNKTKGGMTCKRSNLLFW